MILVTYDPYKQTDKMYTVKEGIREPKEMDEKAYKEYVNYLDNLPPMER